MNTRSNTENNSAIILIALALLLVAFLTWKFSTFLGIDFTSGVSVVFRLILLAALAGIFLWASNEIDFLKISNVWPVFLALLSVCFWPALDYHAQKETISFFRGDEVTVWWGQWYTKVGTFAFIICVGYGIKKIFQRDY